MATHDDHRRQTPSREARLSSVLYAIRGHINDSSLCESECVSKIELELMDFEVNEIGNVRITDEAAQRMTRKIKMLIENGGRNHDEID